METVYTYKLLKKIKLSLFLVATVFISHVQASSLKCIDLLNSAQAQLEARNTVDRMYILLAHNPEKMASSLSVELKSVRQLSTDIGLELTNQTKSEFYTKTSEFGRHLERVELIRERQTGSKKALTSSDQKELEANEKQIHVYLQNSSQYLHDIETFVTEVKSKFIEIRKAELKIDEMLKVWHELGQTQMSEDRKREIALSVIPVLTDLSEALFVQRGVLVSRIQVLHEFKRKIQQAEVAGMRASGALVPMMQEENINSQIKSITPIMPEIKGVNPELKDIFSQYKWSSAEAQISLAKFLASMRRLTWIDLKYLMLQFDMEVSGVQLESTYLTQRFNYENGKKNNYELNAKKWPIEVVNMLVAYTLVDKSFIENDFKRSKSKILVPLGLTLGGVVSSLMLPFAPGATLFFGSLVIGMPTIVYKSSLHFFSRIDKEKKEGIIQNNDILSFFKPCRNDLCKLTKLNFSSILADIDRNVFGEKTKVGELLQEFNLHALSLSQYPVVLPKLENSLQETLNAKIKPAEPKNVEFKTR